MIIMVTYICVLSECCGMERKMPVDQNRERNRIMPSVVPDQTWKKAIGTNLYIHFKTAVPLSRIFSRLFTIETIEQLRTN